MKVGMAYPQPWRAVINLAADTHLLATLKLATPVNSTTSGWSA
jgi:hypothetical protein